MNECCNLMQHDQIIKETLNINPNKNVSSKSKCPI